MAESFDFEFVEKDVYSRSNFPLIYINQDYYANLPMKLTKRKP